ncbi:hypothetical protein BK769_12820 [Bacillus thuringiensis serovar kumamtoensis]|uniref:Uncharacterized protein n=1 Tax=Bacillus thuringiensis serovar kumamotoensis TaxID=132267 RepID=A0A9X6JQ56_BACUK|nr:hypothetical protein BK769_12820 [Bacillus thuringiensis serovar kumamtoensis]
MRIASLIRKAFISKNMIINANEHDRNQFKVLSNDKNTMQVFNYAYVTHQKFNGMTDYTCLSFSQIKKSTVIRIMKSIPLTKNIAVLSEKMIYIACIQNNKQKNNNPLLRVRSLLKIAI